MQVGKSGKLTVSDLYGRAVTWSSSNPAVATVKNGVVTGVKAGKCAVTAKVAKGRTLQCAVAVTDPASLSKSALSLKAGKTARLKVIGLNGRSVAWSSTRPAIAIVKDGVVTAVKAGKCTVIATLSNGRKLKCAVTVAQ